MPSSLDRTIEIRDKSVRHNYRLELQGVDPLMTVVAYSLVTRRPADWTNSPIYKTDAVLQGCTLRVYGVGILLEIVLLEPGQV